MSSFLKELEELNETSAALPDIEDYNFDNTVKAKSKKKHLDDSDDDDAEDDEPMGRKRIHGALELDGTRYQGESVSRAALFGDSSEMNGLSSSRRKKSVGSEESDVDLASDEEDSEGDEDEEESDEKESGDEKEDKDVEDDDDDQMEEDEEEKVNMKDLVKPVQEDEEKKKGESVRKQIALCEQMVLLNIKMHAAMRECNQFPRGALSKALLAEASDEAKAHVAEAYKNSLRLIDTLLAAEDAMLAGSIQTKPLLQGKAAGDEDSEDEEIESSDDEKDDEEKKKNGVEKKDEEEDDDDDGSIPDYNVEGSDGSDDEEEEEGSTKKKKVEGLKALQRRVIQSEIRFEGFRTSTLTKWDQRLRLVAYGKKKDASKDFSAFEGADAISQIEKILSDKRRLVARTQVKRTDGERIGADPEATHDTEIFDDDDFYQLLLRDLIERKTNVETLDPIAMSRQWLELEKLRQRRSKKKTVDRKASKGRKLRYTVIPKLVNYHVAQPEVVEWTHEMRNELFRSLFT